MPIPIPILVAGITALAGAGGAALDRGGSRRAIDRQNEYNDPRNQVARIREAGLPYAAMTGGMAGNQGQAQAETRSGLGEGIKDGIDKYFQTTMQQKQLQLLQSQIDNMNVDTKVKEVEGNTKAYDLQLRQEDLTQGEPVSMGARMAKLDYEMRLINKELMEQSRDIRGIEYNVQNELYKDGTLTTITRKQLEGIINGVELGNQQINRGLVMDTLIEIMKKGGIQLHEALAMAFMTNQLGTGGIHFPNYSPRESNTSIYNDVQHGESRHYHFKND